MAVVERGQGAGAPRLVTANRQQIELRPFDLESLVAADHRSRAIWGMVEGLELGKFYEPIAARGSEPDRPAIDPKILVALWLYATSEGVGSARELPRLCTAHDAYRWLCGGVTVNYHTLSDFRVGYEADAIPSTASSPGSSSENRGESSVGCFLVGRSS